MPFQSEKQRRYLWANEPEIARDWTDTYGSRVEAALGGIMALPQGGRTGFFTAGLAAGDNISPGTSTSGGLRNSAQSGILDNNLLTTKNINTAQKGLDIYTLGKLIKTGTWDYNPLAHLASMFLSNQAKRKGSTEEETWQK
jgi:hypothetical protein